MSYLIRQSFEGYCCESELKLCLQSLLTSQLILSIYVYFASLSVCLLMFVCIQKTSKQTNRLTKPNLFWQLIRKGLWQVNITEKGIKPLTLKPLNDSICSGVTDVEVDMFWI